MVKENDHFSTQERFSLHYSYRVMSRAINAKALINSAILVLAAMFGHAIACGTFIALLPLSLTTLAVIFVLSLLSSTELNGFLLTTLVITCQICAHFLLGSNPTGMGGMGGMTNSTMGPMAMNSTSSMNSAGMITAHLSAAVISFVFIRRNQAFWNALKLFPLTVLYLIFRPVFSFASRYSLQAKSDLTEIVTLVMSYLKEATSRLSAPPIQLIHC